MLNPSYHASVVLDAFNGDILEAFAAAQENTRTGNDSLFMHWHAVADELAQMMLVAELRMERMN